jgi:hypothetical protein
MLKNRLLAIVKNKGLDQVLSKKSVGVLKHLIVIGINGLGYILKTTKTLHKLLFRRVT